MCIRCLERLYVIHAAKIGPFPDLSILMRFMRTSKSVEIRHRLLSLVAALIGVTKSERYDPVDMKENEEQLLNVESISLFCEMCSECHMVTDTSENQSHDHSVSPAMWYTATSDKNPPAIDTIGGPFTLNSLKQLFIAKKVGRKSLISIFDVDENKSDKTNAGGNRIHSSDTWGWLPLEDTPQLRRQILDGASSGILFTPSRVTLLALQCLERLVRVHKSIDSKGIPFFPIPIAKSIICEASGVSPIMDAVPTGFHGNLLSIICQGLLCSDDEVVRSTAQLLRLLMFHNDKACGKLYRTGVAFFILSSAGSDCVSIMKLLEEIHLRQELGGSNFLGQFLPGGLIKVLTNHGVEKFAEIYCGNHDSPEGTFLAFLLVCISLMHQTKSIIFT